MIMKGASQWDVFKEKVAEFKELDDIRTNSFICLIIYSDFIYCFDG